MKIIAIKIENKVVEISLLDKKKVLSSVLISKEHSLSEDLLPMVDKLLRENELTAKNIDKMTLQSDIGDNFTTYRIAKSVVNAFNWAKE